MERYNSLFTTEKSELSNSDLALYREYTLYCYRSNFGELLIEQEFSEGVKDVITLVKEIAFQSKYSFKDLLKMFLDKTIFRFFKAIGFDVYAFWDAVKEGVKKFKQLIKSGGKWLDEPKLLNRVIKVFTSLQLAGTFFYIFIMFGYDRNVTNLINLELIIKLITGRINYITFFNSDDGKELLRLIFKENIKNKLFYVNIASGGAFGMIMLMLRTFKNIFGFKLRKQEEPEE